MQTYIPVLSKCPLFHHIDNEDIEKLLKALHPQKMKADKKQVLFMEGDPAKAIGIVLKGSIQIIRNDFYGNQTIVDRLYPPAIFAETFVCADVPAFPVNIEAVEDCEILLIDIQSILQNQTNVQLLSNLLHILAHKNMVLNNKLTIMSKRSTQAKLMTYLDSMAKKHQSADFYIPFNRQEMADYLGVDRSALSYELSKLKKQGILDYKKNHFKLYKSAIDLS